MNKEMFEMILEKDEEIKWSNGINVEAHIKKNFFKTFLFGLFPPFALLMLGTPYCWLLLLLSILKVIPLWIGIAHFIFSIIVIICYIIILKMDGNNTYFCITNKRVIKRNGAFNNKFIHYTLKNIGTVEVSGGIFDNKGKNPSADLIVTVKDFHLNTDGNSNPRKLVVSSLNNAYEAYKMLNEMADGNNEVIRIKHEN